MDGIRGNILLGLAVAVVLLGGIGAWAATTTLAGAVVATGTVVVESSVKRVQHQTGGIVGEILVREGEQVGASEIVVRFDETSTRANRQIVSNELDRIAARRARLEAELVGLSEMRLPDLLKQRMSDPKVAAVVAGESALLQNRLNAVAGKKAQAAKRIEQLTRQIEGLNAQRRAATEAEILIARDVSGLETLHAKKLVSMERLSEMQLELSRLRGEIGRFAAAIAETEGKMSEIDLQLITLDEEVRREANTDLRETEGREVELMERLVVVDDQLARTVLRAPQAGIVQELAVHTIGGIVGPGETVMLIVPSGDGLVIDARIAPASVNDVQPDQPVSIRFPSFDANTTPECSGSVQRVSADLVTEPQSQLSFFVARIGLDDEKSCLGGMGRLLPGMPAEVYIQTGRRNVWSYAMKPLSDQLSRAFRE